MYQILGRYEPTEEWGEWQVGTFGRKDQAEDYIARETERYHNKYNHPNFELKTVEVTREEATAFNRKLTWLLD